MSTNMQTFTAEQVAAGELASLLDYLLAFNSETCGKTFMDMHIREQDGGQVQVEWEEVPYDLEGDTLSFDGSFPHIPQNEWQAAIFRNIYKKALQNPHIDESDHVVVGPDLIGLLIENDDVDYDPSFDIDNPKARIAGVWRVKGGPQSSYRISCREEAMGQLWFMKPGRMAIKFNININGR